jgi:hypothetical protein
MFHLILLLTRWISVVGLIGSLSFPAGAANFTVTTDNDVVNSGDGVISLREAIVSANAANDVDTINITATGTITLTSGQLDITNPVIINGNGIIISGDGDSRVFYIDTGTTVTINNLTIANGYAAYGAGIYNYGEVTLNNCTLTGNTSTDSSWGGGAIKNQGTLQVVNSTISNNTANIKGGGIANYGTAELVHVTLVKNDVTDSTDGQGGGIYNVGTILTITNSIISGNTSTNDNPEIYHDGSTFTATGKNILGLNGGWGTNIAETALGNCLKPDAGSAIGNIVNNLADNGGPTQTRAPVFGGLAHNAGDNSAAVSANLEYDQRGGWRILDGQVDIGAVEIGTVPLNDTGIQFCGAYPNGNNAICSGTEPTGQDKFYGRDADTELIKTGGGVAGFDYTKIANDGVELTAGATLGTGATDWACTRDNVTGLMWEVKTDNTTPDLRDKDWTYTWYDSNSPDGNKGTANGGICFASGSGCDTEKYVADVNAAGLCGFNDWRMPTIKELRGIAHLGPYNPAIDTTYFPNTNSSWFWSGSSLAGYSWWSWQVHFNNGAASYGWTDDSYYVRLVRGGQSFNSFVDNGDGTVTQTNTGLMWAKCSEGQTGSDCSGGSESTMAWDVALTTANNSSLASYSDWRLPNVTELTSLLEDYRVDPSINNTVFPNTPSDWFWSGSPCVSSSYTWNVYFWDGHVEESSRDFFSHIRFVRGGESFNTFNLTVNKTGNGTVTSNGNLINCGVTCAFPFFDTTRVTLTAVADAGSTFTGWSGGDCSGTGTCVVTMDADKTVTATFTSPLTITNSGNGTVTGPDSCIDDACNGDYAGVITLTATPDTDYQFAGWSGACSDANVICNVSMTSAQDVQATFAPITTDTSWEQITPAPTPNDLNAVAYGNGKFVAVGTVGDTNAILISTDGGLSWTEAADSDVALNGVAWSGGQFVAIGDNGRILTSTDGGTNWDNYSLGINANLGDVTWDGRQFMAVGTAGTILTSSDGETWTTQTPVTTVYLRDVTWCGSQFIAVGDDGTILISPDGETWTSLTSGIENIERVVWNGSKFVAVGVSGTILTSSNGSTWVTRVSNTTNSLYGLTWNGNQFVAVGLSGTILTSSDGETWTTQTPVTTVYLRDVTWCGSQFIAVGDDGTILISPATSKTLTVTTTGSGTITGAAVGIDCGADCTANIQHGLTVTLTAAPAGGSLLGVWGGCIPVANNPWQCQVTMDAAKTVTATFITAGLNDTGITTCSKGTVNDYTCPLSDYPDQDAEHGTNSFNFTKLDAAGNALPVTATNHVCVRDNVTGLIWEVKTNDGGLRDKDNLYTFTDTTAFVTSVNTSSLCGASDWRLPTVKELLGIVNHRLYTPAIDANYFPNTLANWFWSSSQNLSFLDEMYNVDFDFRDVEVRSKSQSYALRLVHGGQSIDVFVDNGDGTVTQTNTGLMWAKCAVGLSDTNCATGSPTLMIWKDALNNASASTLGGYNDWRLPNVKELQALVDYSSVNPNPAISAVFPNTPLGSWWSSTPDTNTVYSYVSWYINFGNGLAYERGRTWNDYVRLVRGGQSFQAFNLTTATTGTGSGTVTTDLTGTSCGANCQTFNERTIVVLTAIADSGYTFAGWSGCAPLVGAPNQCQVTMDAAKNVTATFNPLTYSITTTANPTAGGSVTCSPNPVNSGADSTCTATANPGYSFAGFSGDCSGTTCALTNVTANKTVTANFTLNTYSIAATANPTVGGTVSCTAYSVGYNGSSMCTATPNSGYSFTGFNGDCSGTSCVLTNITNSKTVTANFTPLTYSITATVNPNAGGAINCSPSAVAYNGTASCLVIENAGYTFTRFSGDCSGTTCILTNITTNKVVTANFSLNAIALTVIKNGTGTGIVTSAATEINCGITCATTFGYGTAVTLTASPATGSTFTGWSGACSGTGACSVTMNAAQTVTATFRSSTTPLALNDTGINTCGTTTTNNLPCPIAGFSGQDAEYGSNQFNFTKLDLSGAELPATATNHACVRDNVTGLIWEIKTKNSGIRDGHLQYKWKDRLAYVQNVNAMRLCGFNDWRVPDIKELTGIVNYQHSIPKPAIENSYFSDFSGALFFWAESTSTDLINKAWFLSFTNGVANYGDRNKSYHLRLVRGAQANNVFVENSDGTISQTNTGLMWAKCSEGQSGDTCTGTATTLTWALALTTADSANLAGYSDWRLPNIKELQALIDYERAGNSKLNPLYFPNTPAAAFWSSTPFALYARYAWYLYADGYLGTQFRTKSFHVRLVRSL